MLERLREGLRAAVERLIGASTVDEEALRTFLQDVQRALLQADVNVNQVLELSERVMRKVREEKPPPGLSLKDHIVKVLYEELVRILGGGAKLELPYNKLNLILLVGVQGSGKTLAAAKLARYLARRGYKPGLVGADTFRPGALDQLRQLADLIHTEVYGEKDGGDSLAIALRGTQYFKERGRNVVMVDTAGRHKEERGLIEEMRGLAAALKPDITFLVLDAGIGQQSFAQAQAFHQVASVGGIIITKLDGAAKGGGAIAAAAATGAKIFFMGTGELVDDIEDFSPHRFVGRLLGLGDLQALLERARELEAEGEEERVRRILGGRMTMDDVYYQLEQLRKMGPLHRIMELIPGLSGMVGGEDAEELEDKMRRWRSIIQSMTKDERRDPSLLNASRIRRISKGSGRSEKEVKELLAYYRQAQVMMKTGRSRLLKQLMRKFPTS